MLKMIDKADVPGYRNADKSPARRFAAQTVREFLEVAEVGDIAEVEDAPVEMDADGVRKLYSAMRDELFYMDRGEDMRKKVRVFTRGGRRVFLERTEPFAPNPRAVQKPYPDHIKRGSV